MQSFDITFFILAVLGTAGMIGIGISFAQTSLPLFLFFLALSLGSVFIGFRRKKQLRSSN